MIFDTMKVLILWGDSMKLILEDIHKSFSEHQVLKGCSYEFEKGKIYGLLGRNGSGKTTLFNILYQELEADKGKFYIQEEGGIKRRLTLDDIGMVFTDSHLPDFLTGKEFVQFFLDIHGDQNSKTADEYLDMVDLNVEDRNRIIKGYSSGMKSKVSLLTVLIAKPNIILLDEPLTAVDVVVGIQLKRLLKELRHDHILILSTHILSLAEDMCESFVLLRQGQLDGTESFRNQDEFEQQIIQSLSDQDGETNHEEITQPAGDQDV